MGTRHADTEDPIPAARGAGLTTSDLEWEQMWATETKMLCLLLIEKDCRGLSTSAPQFTGFIGRGMSDGLKRKKFFHLNDA